METAMAKAMAHKLRLSGKSVTEIASTVGKSERWVKDHTKKAAIAYRTKVGIECFKLRNRGKSDSDIAELLGIRRQSVDGYISHFMTGTVPSPEVHKPSEEREDGMREVKWMIDMGYHSLEILEEVGMDRSLLDRIRYWRTDVKSGHPYYKLCSYNNGEWDPDPQQVYDWTHDIEAPSESDADLIAKQHKAADMLMDGVPIETICRNLDLSRSQVVELT